MSPAMASCPKKTNLTSGLSMDLKYSNCEISKMKEPNRSLVFDLSHLCQEPCLWILQGGMLRIQRQIAGSSKQRVAMNWVSIIESFYACSDSVYILQSHNLYKNKIEYKEIKWNIIWYCSMLWHNVEYHRVNYWNIMNTSYKIYDITYGN